MEYPQNCMSGSGLINISAAEIDALGLMPLETPILKVSRPVAACSRCRNAKIKCDGKLPACSSCEKNGRAAECTSTNDQFARGKERSYVSTLETRIDRLQEKLELARARKPSVISMHDDETAPPSRRPSYQVTEPPTPVTTRKERRTEATAIDDLVSDFGFLSVNATARDFYGFTSAMTYAKLIFAACSKDPLPQGTTKALPPRYAATPLIQHYFSNAFSLLPCFDEASFFASVDKVYSRNPAAQLVEAQDHWIVRMVLAIGSASMSDQRGDQHYLEGIGHVGAALEYAEAVLHPGSISSVQALLLLTEYAMLDPHHFDSWSLIGAASRAMVDLGLHHDPPKGAHMSKGHLELRRRVFYCVYALDRSTSLVQTRAFSFSDDSAQVKIPFTRAPTSAPSSPAPNGQSIWLQSSGHALDLVGLRQIQSKWYTDLFQSGRQAWSEPYPYIWNTCDEMRQWFENLSSSTSDSMRAFFELDLLYSYIYVLSPSPRVPIITPFAQTLIFEHCMRYASLMSQLMDDPGYNAPFTFYDAMRVYMTGRQFLDVLNHNADGLLNGQVPPLPEVLPSTAPPPQMPNIPLPPGETVQHFNTNRSIRCLKQTTDCLARFGIRWGYMSWNQRFQKEIEPMLENLHLRRRELQDMGQRRPSMWHHSSAGSISSSNVSLYQRSAHNSAAGQSVYQPTPPLLNHSSSYGESSDGRHGSSPQYQTQTQTVFQQPQYSFTQATMPQSQPPSQYFVTPQQFDINSHAQPYPNPSAYAAPTQQFAGWQGYGGPSVPDTLDEENAAFEHARDHALERRPNLYPTTEPVEDFLRDLFAATAEHPTVGSVGAAPSWLDNHVVQEDLGPAATHRQNSYATQAPADALLEPPVPFMPELHQVDSAQAGPSQLMPPPPRPATRYQTTPTCPPGFSQPPTFGAQSSSGPLHPPIYPATNTPAYTFNPPRQTAAWPDRIGRNARRKGRPAGAGKTHRRQRKNSGPVAPGFDEASGQRFCNVCSYRVGDVRLHVQSRGAGGKWGCLDWGSSLGGTRG
ncbi:hypothetical protein MBLNU230_g4927t1 [Neophaeotheca triangularis]